MKRATIHTSAAIALLLGLAACTQDELADDNRLPEGEYPVVIRATGLSVEATPQAAPSTRATVDGDWQGVTSVALKTGDAVKEYTVTASTDFKSATLSRENDPHYWTSRDPITVSAWWPFDNADITQIAYAQNRTEYQEYYAVYRELVKIKRELDAQITDESEKQRRIDLLSYQVQEIEDAALTAGEEQTLESRRKVLSNASTIRDRIAQCYTLLSGDDETPGAVDLLGEASNAVDAAAQLDGELSTSAGQLLDLYYNAKDAAADLIGRLDAYETNDAELDEIEQRIDLIYKLKRKYGDTVEDIIAFGQKAREELELIQSSQERVEHLQAEQHRLYVLAREKAETLTQTRLKAFEELNKRISGTLDFLNMPGVRMTLHHARGPLASHGQDSIEFYISTNPGEAPKPLAKIASGGELSRITLAIKNAMADKDAVPTVIYDEIDSGVSGKAASRIGEVLRQSAEGHQILCITHTAQIAALADCHLLIQKNIANERTYTEIHPLDEDGRVDALAHLISGDHVTELSRANAREMLEQTRNGR